ncbi:MAG: hypothetical protein ACXAEN_22420 [Candidatus Thorarchaeota archaeon]
MNPYNYGYAIYYYPHKDYQAVLLTNGNWGRRSVDDATVLKVDYETANQLCLIIGAMTPAKVYFKYFK